ncbi:protein-glutamine gamma-glutamyltransferase [Paenibacillus xerothermodurans]|uniref:Protein-glutamine gamma-glutamyltransferase n=1 Tax=Paenibacillus xerothermodurans TaxID=1977292 RepID=A0A2W1NVE2_PAEXE|nr:protein-glutamine gamma-glutamyltransferase [Paenibacillus xerothermodurans]PZE19662.1 protein-glutamine gamma-glutamyltransferase [Paenibacillus xerothermodurans]
MIVIAGQSASAFDGHMLSGLERMIYVQKQESSIVYRYNSVDSLMFELRMRTRIVAAARALAGSGARFATFENSQCNEAYWHRTAAGGFRLRSGVAPQAGIRDIFVNGGLYAFECATAMVIVLYKAALDSIDPNQFDRLFANVYLFDWLYDNDLRLIDRANPGEAVPGDVLYFENPDVSSATPWWRGENAIVMGGGLLYGHGIGLTSAEEIINVLNRHREPGSTRSAYLTDKFTQVDFSYLQQFRSAAQATPIIAKVGSRKYVC